MEGPKRDQVSSPAYSCLRHGPLTVEIWCVQKRSFAQAPGVVMYGNVRRPEGTPSFCQNGKRWEGALATVLVARMRRLVLSLGSLL